MYYDDFYNEPSEFEAQIDEFKQSLINAVKQDYQAEMARLHKENAELQEIKKRKKEIEAEHSRALHQFATDKENYERQLKKMRIAELLGEYMLVGWFPASHRVEKSKCDKCNNNRKIRFTSPSGKEYTEDCPICGTPTNFYEPEEIECYQFYQHKDTFGREYAGVGKYYTRKEDRDYDTFERSRTVYKGEPFEEVQSYSVVFFKQEDCQKYCDWKNNPQEAGEKSI